MCEKCGLSADKAWESYEDKNYGFIWGEIGYCRNCWKKACEKMAREELVEETVIYRGAF